jgi:excisionase family DNA binding protein
MSAKETAHRYLSPGEVTALLGLSRMTVYRRIRAGDLPALRLGDDGPLRVDAAELERWLKEKAVRGDDDE